MPIPIHNFKYRRLLQPLLLFLTIFSIIFTTGCAKESTSVNGDAGFQTFTGQLFQQEVSSNTISLHYTLQNPKDYGILDVPVTFGSYDVNEIGAKAALENCMAALHTFSYEDLSKKNQLTYDVLDSYLETAVQGSTFSLYDEPLSPLTGIQAQLPVLLSEYQFRDISDIDTYLELLATTPDYFDSLIRFEQQKSNAGLFMSAPSDDAIIQECNSFVAMGDSNYLYDTFEERLQALGNLSDSQVQQYIAKNREMITSYVFPSYEHLSAALTTLSGTGKNDRGLYYLPNGRDYYDYVVKRETGSSRSVPELKKLTKAQIVADLQSMQTFLDSSAETAAQVAVQNKNALVETEPTTILHDLEAKITKTFPRPPEVTTRVKYVPDIMQKYMSPAFYMIPTIDNVSENVIYINEGRTMDGIELYTTLAHEGYPGHLYQTVYYANQNPDPVRNMLNVGGYVEGWATYAEMTSYYMAPLTKEQSTLLQKNNSATLGLYALADIGIHYEGWSLADTVSFFQDYGITDSTAVSGIYNLIVGDPANYLKYYIGYVEFLELKKDAINTWGDAFSQEKFHKAVLNVGPATFDVVRKYALNQ